MYCGCSSVAVALRRAVVTMRCKEERLDPAVDYKLNRPRERHDYSINLPVV